MSYYRANLKTLKQELWDLLPHLKSKIYCMQEINIGSFKKAIEYIQDFVNIYGIKIWQEEFNRVINKYIDLEANTFLSKQV